MIGRWLFDSHHFISICIANSNKNMDQFVPANKALVALVCHDSYSIVFRSKQPIVTEYSKINILNSIPHLMLYKINLLVLKEAYNSGNIAYLKNTYDSHPKKDKGSISFKKAFRKICTKHVHHKLAPQIQH